MKLYQKIAAVLGTRYVDETIHWIETQFLPSGSGIDCGTKVDLAGSRKDRVVLTFEYHFMNDGGYYDGWESYKVVIKPDLVFGYDMRITGPNRNQIKEYLYDTFNGALNQEYVHEKDFLARRLQMTGDINVQEFAVSFKVRTKSPCIIGEGMVKTTLIKTTDADMGPNSTIEIVTNPYVLEIKKGELT